MVAVIGTKVILLNDTGNMTKKQSFAQEIEFDRLRVF
jgi:hypothetical protein